MRSLPIRLAGVKRAHAELYLLLMLLSFATSVTATRLFLQLTGYPQLGSSELHIAHVLWGGLLLFLGVLLPLILANRWAFPASALMGGTGVGLFIDEIGKFITQSNDYFYPFAAPIIYAFFLLTVLVYLRVKRRGKRNTRAELYLALDGLLEVLDRDFERDEQVILLERLSFVAEQADHPNEVHLATALRDLILSDGLEVMPDRPSLWERLRRRLEAYETRYLRKSRLRWLLILGLGIVGLLSALQLLVSLAALFVPDLLREVAIELLATEQRVRGAISLTWYWVRMVLEGLNGTLLLVGSALIVLRRDELGTRLGYYGLLLTLTTVNLLVFYFDQFGTITQALVQFVLLLGVLSYRRRFAIPAQARRAQDTGEMEPEPEGL